VDDANAAAMGPPWTRRYVYNHSSCGRCGSDIKRWAMANRTAYVCELCQPLLHLEAEAEAGSAAGSKKKQASPIGKKQRHGMFQSHCEPDCAPDSAADLSLKRAQSQGASGGGGGGAERMLSAANAAAEKMRAGEGRGVKHVADHDDASDALPAAAVRARHAEVKPKPKGSTRRAAKAEAEQTPEGRTPAFRKEEWGIPGESDARARFKGGFLSLH